jgi:hypothetical protein
MTGERSSVAASDLDMSVPLRVVPLNRRCFETRLQASLIVM